LACLEEEVARVSRYLRYPLPSLEAAELAALERDYRTGEHRLVRQRAQIVLLVYSLPSQEDVAQAVRCSLDTVQRALTLYRKGGRAALRPQRPPRQEPVHKRTLAWQKALAAAMEAGPEACGYARPTWTAPLLAEYLEQQTGVGVDESTVRRGLASLGYVCRRPTWTVRHKAEEQENYAPKGRGSKHS
jgi:transposase